MNEATSPRHRNEEFERACLSAWAAFSAETKGRDRYEEPDRLRTAFQLDRDRIVHSAGFRRLAGKSHRIAWGALPARFRLHRVLEVAQAARTIGRGLRLNEDLIEAVALAMEVGNTAFGAAGEEALQIFEGGFEHEEQSLRIVEGLEAGGRGLNLTWEVRDGILHHPLDSSAPATLEAQVVREAGRAVTACDDLQMCADAGLVRGEVPADVARVLSATPEQRIAMFAEGVVTGSLDQPHVRTTPGCAEVLDTIERFVARRLHGHPELRTQRSKVIHCLRSVAVFYAENPRRLPDWANASDPPAVRVRDWISWLTDGEVVAEFRELFTPEEPR